MKIGLDARGAILYRGTGIGTYTYQLVKNLSKIAPENEYQFFWPGDEYKHLDPFDDVFFNEIERNKDKFWEEVHLPLSIKNKNIDLYHVPQNGIGLPKKKDCKFVTTIHDLIPYNYPETTGAGYLRTFLREMPHIMEQSDMVITVSQFSKRDIQRYFNIPDEKITVTHEAAEDFYRPIAKQAAKSFVKKKFGIDSRFILNVGGLSERKNIFELIRAFYQVQKDIPEDYKLVIVGETSRRKDKKLHRMVEALDLQDKIVFPGFIPVLELPYLYNAADLFIYPSIFEGFGLPPLEAMACGTPVIASNTTSIPEVTGDAAILFNPKKTIEIAESIEKVINNDVLLQELSKKSLAQAGKFTWEKCAQETLAAYKKVLGQ